jgi:hypothetical protein
MSAEESSSDAGDAVGWYDDHAESIVERYESLAPEKVNAWLEPLLPSQPALVLARRRRLGTRCGLVGFTRP